MTCGPGLPLQPTRNWKPKAFADPGVCSVQNLNFISTHICIYIAFYVSSDDNPRHWVSQAASALSDLWALRLEEAMPDPCHCTPAHQVPHHQSHGLTQSPSLLLSGLAPPQGPEHLPPKRALPPQP